MYDSFPPIEGHYQKETRYIMSKRISNEVELIKKLKPAEIRLFNALKEHLNEVLAGNSNLLDNNKKWLNYYLEDERGRVLNSNVIYLSEDFLYDYEVIDPSQFSRKTNAAYKARSFIKRLVTAGVVAKYLGPKEAYIVNPTYIYFGETFASCYEDWCRTTGVDMTDPKQMQLVQGVDKRCDPKTRLMSTLPNRFNAEQAALAGHIFSLKPKEECDLDEDILDQVGAVSKDSPEVQDQIEAKQQEQLRKEKIKHYKSNQTSNMFININCIKELGEETARECIDPQFFNIALNELQTQSTDLPF